MVRNLSKTSIEIGRLTERQVEQWHALRMMIGFCRGEAEALGADFLVYCLELGLIAADDHMRGLEAQRNHAGS